MEHDQVLEVTRNVVIVNGEPTWTLDYIKKLQLEIDLLRTALLYEVERAEGA